MSPTLEPHCRHYSPSKLGRRILRTQRGREEVSRGIKGGGYNMKALERLSLPVGASHHQIWASASLGKDMRKSYGVAIRRWRG